MILEELPEGNSLIFFHHLYRIVNEGWYYSDYPEGVDHEKFPVYVEQISEQQAAVRVQDENAQLNRAELLFWKNSDIRWMPAGKNWGDRGNRPLCHPSFF